MFPELPLCFHTPPAQTPECWPHGARRGKLKLLPDSRWWEISVEPVVDFEIHHKVNTRLVALVPDVVRFREVHVVEVPDLHFDLLAAHEECHVVVGDNRHMQ